MQIVIDIDGGLYEWVHRQLEADEGWSMVQDSIMSGKVLPEGHGRISDMDAAIKCIEDVKGEDAIYAISLIEWACGKRVLIEADRSEDV